MTSCTPPMRRKVLTVQTFLSASRHYWFHRLLETNTAVLSTWEIKDGAADKSCLHPLEKNLLDRKSVSLSWALQTAKCQWQETLQICPWQSRLPLCPA